VFGAGHGRPTRPLYDVRHEIMLEARRTRRWETCSPARHNPLLRSCLSIESKRSIGAPKQEDREDVWGVAIEFVSHSVKSLNMGGPALKGTPGNGIPKKPSFDHSSWPAFRYTVVIDETSKTTHPRAAGFPFPITAEIMDFPTSDFTCQISAWRRLRLAGS
jgi:hypothetical protein